MKKVKKENKESDSISRKLFSKHKNNSKNNKKESKIKTYLKKFKSITKKEKKTYSFEEVLIVLFFSLGLGFFACLSFVRIFSGGKSYFSISKDLEKVIDTYYTIVDNYYGDLDKESIVEGAVNGMIAVVGDTYTSYSNANDTSSFLETVAGVYDGIGCTVGNNSDGNIIVVNVFEGGPSDKAGLKADDVIIKIDDKDFTGKTSTDMANYIKENKKNAIKVTVKRNSEELKISINKSSVEIPTVTSKIFEINNNKIGYIDISLFTSVTGDQFKKNLIKLEKENINSLLIDVRGNSGGYLSVVTNISNMLLEKGKAIYQLQDEKGTTITKDSTKEKRTYSIGILINGSSASASEILASVIKESYPDGFVIGTNSYGKGTVQQTMNLQDGSMIKYTVQNWLTPNGNWINEKGVEPTNAVEQNESYYQTFAEEDDNQLQEALKILSNK